MKGRLKLLLPLLLLIVALTFMVKDLFINKSLQQDNPYEYNLDKLKNVEEDLISHKEIKSIFPDVGRLFAINVDKNDNLYVATMNGILIYSKDFELISEIPCGKSIAIFVNEKDEIFLGKKDHIEIWTRKPEKIASWDVINELATITSIAVTDESVFAADAGNKIVYHYNQKGELLNKIGAKDLENGIPGFVIPSPYFDLLIGRDNELWVVNPGRHSFEAYDELGNLKSSWTKTSMQLDGFSGCCNPCNIALLSDGSFVTSEKGLERVKIHGPTGDFISVVAAPEDFDEGTKGIDLAVDSQDRIFVMDPKRGQIRIFERK